MVECPTILRVTAAVAEWQAEQAAQVVPHCPQVQRDCRQAQPYCRQAQ